MPSPNWIHYQRRATWTQRSSCNCWGITWASGLRICKILVCSTLNPSIYSAVSLFSRQTRWRQGRACRSPCRRLDFSVIVLICFHSLIPAWLTSSQWYACFEFISVCMSHPYSCRIIHSRTRTSSNVNALNCGSDYDVLFNYQKELNRASRHPAPLPQRLPQTCLTLCTNMVPKSHMPYDQECHGTCNRLDGEWGATNSESKRESKFSSGTYWNCDILQVLRAMGMLFTSGREELWEEFRSVGTAICSQRCRHLGIDAIHIWQADIYIVNGGLRVWGHFAATMPPLYLLVYDEP